MPQTKNKTNTLLFAFLPICFMYWTTPATITHKTKETLILTASLGGIKYLEKSPPVCIATTIFNPTDDTIRFLTMTCSYDDFFLTDTAEFKVQSYNFCYSNVPIFITLPPKSKTDRFIMVKSDNPNFTPNDYVKYKIKIGMYVITWNKNLCIYRLKSVPYSS
jgi:hypothetical protein